MMLRNEGVFMSYLDDLFGLAGKAIINHSPYGRFGEAEELEGATLFLASHKASGFITGISIPVDGDYLSFNI